MGKLQAPSYHGLLSLLPSVLFIAQGPCFYEWFSGRLVSENRKSRENRELLFQLT